MQRRIEELLGRFRVEVRDQLGRALEVGKQHRDLLALAFQGAAGGEDFLREIGRRVGERRRSWVAGWAGAWGAATGVARPDQARAPSSSTARRWPSDEFVLQIVQSSRRRAGTAA